MESFLISLAKKEEVVVEEAAVGIVTGVGANEARAVDVGRKRVDVVAEADLVEHICTR